MNRIFFLILCFLGYFSFSQDNEAIFKKGIEQYNQGEYDNAINSFENIVDNGYHSAELYYNIANSYYKKGDVANSIYYYEKALRLKPHDKDIKNNLLFARQMVVDKIVPLPKIWVERVTDVFISIHSSGAWAMAALTMFLASIGAFIFYYMAKIERRKKIFFTLSVVFFIIAAIDLFFANRVYNIETSQIEGIVFEKELEVFPEPNSFSKSAFKIHEGTKVTTQEYLGQWVRIQLENGNGGWIKSSAIKIIKI